MSRQRREVHEANMGRCTDLEQAWQNSHDLQISQFSIYLSWFSVYWLYWFGSQPICLCLSWEIEIDHIWLPMTSIWLLLTDSNFLTWLNPNLTPDNTPMTKSRLALTQTDFIVFTEAQLSAPPYWHLQQRVPSLIPLSQLHFPQKAKGLRPLLWKPSSLGVPLFPLSGELPLLPTVRILDPTKSTQTTNLALSTKLVENTSTQLSSFPRLLLPLTPPPTPLATPLTPTSENLSVSMTEMASLTWWTA